MEGRYLGNAVRTGPEAGAEVGMAGGCSGGSQCSPGLALLNGDGMCPVVLGVGGRALGPWEPLGPSLQSTIPLSAPACASPTHPLRPAGPHRLLWLN